MKLRRSNYDPVAAGARCAECPLRGKPFVPPEGPSDAALVIVGEGPGVLEERQGRPFIGPSGVKLNEILRAVGLARSQVYVTNATLCRPEVPGIQGPKRFDLPTYIAHVRKENARARKEWNQRNAVEVAQLKKWLKRVERDEARGISHDSSVAAWKETALKRLEALEYVPTPDPVTCCAPRLWRELMHFEQQAQNRNRLLDDRPNGAVIVTCDNYATRTVTGLNAGIMKLRGSPLPVNFEKRLSEVRDA